jgi:hypothetical protein
MIYAVPGTVAGNRVRDEKNVQGAFLFKIKNIYIVSKIKLLFFFYDYLPLKIIQNSS